MKNDLLGKPHAVVIGLESIVGLQTARILNRRDVPVIAITDDADSYCCRTNSCERIISIEPADPSALVEALLNLAKSLSAKAVLFPCTDMQVLHISRNREVLEPAYHIVLPENDIVEMLMDKISFFRFAEEHNFPVPRTRFLTSRDDALIAAESLDFPCILKPPKKTPEWFSNAKVGVYKVSSPEEFLSLYDVCYRWAETLMIQEWIDGSDASLFSCNCYFSTESVPLVTFIARKLRQWPPEAGTSSLGEECRNDFVLRESLRLFSTVSYKGLGYVEIKQDRISGKYYIIEPNIGRPTGRSAIAEAGDVELLYTMYCDALGLPLPSRRTQKYGNAKWIYWRRDFQAALFYWRRGDLSLRDWFSSWRGRKFSAVFSWTDPAPFFADILRVVGMLLAGGADKRAMRSEAALEAAGKTSDPTNVK